MAKKVKAKKSKKPTITSLQEKIQSLQDENKVLIRTVLRHMDLKFKKHQLDVDTLENNLVVVVREEIRAANRVVVDPFNKQEPKTFVEEKKQSFLGWIFKGETIK